MIAVCLRRGPPDNTYVSLISALSVHGDESFMPRASDDSSCDPRDHTPLRNFTIQPLCSSCHFSQLALVTLAQPAADSALTANLWSLRHMVCAFVRVRVRLCACVCSR